MARTFISGKGRTLCAENEAECRTCGRSLEEIQATRRIIDDLAGFIVDMEYESANDFLLYIAGKVSRKAAYLNDQKRQALTNGYH